MQNIVNVPVKLSSVSSQQSSVGQIRVQEWDPKARFRRALKLGAYCWGAAVVSVFLPIVHFILVPGFFIAGPLVVIYFSGQSKVILDGTGKCPKCGGDFTVARAPYRFPVNDLCTKCRSEVMIDL